MDHVAVMPLRLAFEVLEHLLVVAVHLRAVRVLAVDVLALEDDAEPDLVGVLGGPEHRVVDPAVWRVVLELGHLLHERVGVSWLQLIPRDRSEHYSVTSTSEQGELLDVTPGLVLARVEKHLDQRALLDHPVKVIAPPRASDVRQKLATLIHFLDDPRSRG